ncbi:MAG: YfiR family protein [Myxococcota bacterium]
MKRVLRTLCAMSVGMTLLGAPSGARAESAGAVRAALVLRILAFDRNLAARTQPSVTVAVIFKAGVAESEAAQKEMVADLSMLTKKVTVAGKPVRIVSLPYTQGQLDAALAKVDASAIYVCPGLEDEVAAISKTTRGRSTLSLTSVEQAVKQGLAVGVVRRDNKSGILVNLPASRAEGADLDSGLLRVAEVLR